MTVVSNGQFLMYTIALLILWIIVATTALINEAKVENHISLLQENGRNELKSEGICKNLCKQCGCLGFYCGEECICECNDDHTDTQCITKIQVNAQNVNAPFEVLIQGPTANKFVRNALQFEENRDRKLYGYRNARSTVTVYKPNKDYQNVHLQSRTSDMKHKFKNRGKRSSNSRLEWLSDIRNNLLRPAPFGCHRHKSNEPREEVAAAQGTAIPSMSDNSWIFDDAHNILTPRPLNKYKSSKVLSSDDNENDADTSAERTSRQFNYDFADDQKLSSNYTEGQISYKNSFATEQKQHEEESQENLIGSLYSHLLKNHFSSDDEKSPPDYPIDDQHFLSFKEDVSSVESERGLFSEEEEEKKDSLASRRLKQDSTTSQVSSSPANINKKLQDLRFPWFRPGKFLEKFRQVINA